MTDADRLTRFVFDRFPVRGELVHLDATWQAVLECHDYPPIVRRVLAEAMGAASLLASTLKFDGKLTMQLQGDGPLHLVVVQCTDTLALRGLARWRGDDPTGALPDLVGDGRLTITVESGPNGQRFQGIVPLEGSSIADCMEAYFATSQQLPTRLWLAAGEGRISGMLLQRLPTPGAKPGEAQDDDWRRVCLLADTLTGDELSTLPDRTILRRLFHEDDVRVFEPRPVSFRCSCSRERIEATLKSLGSDEVSEVLAERGCVEVTCEFCNRRYVLDKVDADALFAPSPPHVGSRSVH